MNKLIEEKENISQGMLENAIDKNASEIHVIYNILTDKPNNVKFRVNGELKMFRDITNTLALKIIRLFYKLSDDKEYLKDYYHMRTYQSTNINGTKFNLPKEIKRIRLQFSPLVDSGNHLMMKLDYN